MADVFRDEPIQIKCSNHSTPDLNTILLISIKFSADCQTVDHNALKIVAPNSQLPAEHGTVITYYCARKHAKKGGAENLLKCQDGTISFTEGSTPCFKIGKSLNILLYLSIKTKTKTSDMDTRH